MIQTSQRARCVGLNAHLLSLTQNYRGAGINGYIFQLLSHLPLVVEEPGGAGLEYVAFLHDAGFHARPGLAVERSRWNTRSPWRRIVWEQTRLAVVSRRLALLHGLAFAAPLATACPTVISVHDLSFLRFPEAFRPLHRTYLSLFTVLSARRAARVIVASESTARDVVSLCGVPAGRVQVIPNGVSPVFTPADRLTVAEFRRRKGLPDRFILFLGTLEPRKNVLRLLEAYAQLKGMGPRALSGSTEAATAPEDLPKLIIAGGKGWFYERIFARVAELGLSDDVYFPGFVPGDELPWWYRAAEVFVYPSLFEGFGLPVLEAMACGTPVITSTASSLPEVAGNAALLVDPEETAELADALHRACSDLNLRDQLRAAGLQQAARFSWSHTARATAAVYRDVLGIGAEEA